jgi:hypothetical protein
MRKEQESGIRGRWAGFELVDDSRAGSRFECREWEVRGVKRQQLIKGFWSQ